MGSTLVGWMVCGPAPAILNAIESVGAPPLRQSPPVVSVLSLAFVFFERVRPRYSQQKVLRRGILTDLAYVVFNGHFLGLLMAIVTAPLVTLQSGANSLFREGGTAIMIHEGPDDYVSDPAGAAGPRVACGVIQPVR